MKKRKRPIPVMFWVSEEERAQIEEKMAQLIAWLKALGLRIHISNGEFQTVLGLVGDTSAVDVDLCGF